MLIRLRQKAILLGLLVCAVGGPMAGWASGTSTAAARTAETDQVRRAVPKLIWGPVTLPSGKSAFPIYHRLGVNVFEIDLNWAQTAPHRPSHPTNPHDPAYRWPTEIAMAISLAERYRIHICLLVQGAPKWSNGGRSQSWAPTDPSAYGSFLIAASRHYPMVHDWMIWGEPNRNGNFEPMPSNSPVGPHRYALVLNAAYHALKRASKNNIVIGGDTWTFGQVPPADFIKWMRLPDGKAPPLDYYGHNPFSVRFPNLRQGPYYPGLRDLNDIDTLEQQLRGIYHRQVKLWLSEYTVSSDRNNRAFDFHVSRKAQARWVGAAFRLVNSVRYVSGLGWFELLDEPPSVPRHLTNGLMTWNVHPKPAFFAYRRAR